MSYRLTLHLFRQAQTELREVQSLISEITSFHKQALALVRQRATAAGRKKGWQEDLDRVALNFEYAILHCRNRIELVRSYLVEARTRFTAEEPDDQPSSASDSEALMDALHGLREQEVRTARAMMETRLRLRIYYNDAVRISTIGPAVESTTASLESLLDAIVDIDTIIKDLEDHVGGIIG